MSDTLSTDLKPLLRRLKLGRILDTLPERLAVARSQKTPHQDFLALVLADEISRRDSQSATVRAQRAHLDPAMQIEAWDDSAKVTFDKTLLNELVSLRFLDGHRHVIIVGPVGVGKTFLSHALGHIACRRGRSVLAIRADQIWKTLKHARLDNTYETELRKLIAVDLLVVDDFGLDAMDTTESRGAYEVSPNAIVPARSSPPRTVAPTSGSPLSPIPFVPRAPSTASPTTPTTSSSRASRTGPG